jgi:hypothetical protein
MSPNRTFATFAIVSLLSILALIHVAEILELRFPTIFDFLVSLPKVSL